MGRTGENKLSGAALFNIVTGIYTKLRLGIADYCGNLLNFESK